MSGAKPFEIRSGAVSASERKEEAMLPAKIKSSGRNALSAFQRARQRLAAAAQEQRPTGLERRTTFHRCAESSKPFMILWVRTASGTQFTVQDIRKLGQPSSSAANGAAQSSRSYEMGEFDTSGQHCPWCLSREGFLICSQCDETVCGGRTQVRNGATWTACTDECGWSGFTVPATAMPACEEVAAPARAAIGSQKRSALPPPPRRLLK
jgi:hypothetical protein